MFLRKEIRITRKKTIVTSKREEKIETLSKTNEASYQ